MSFRTGALLTAVCIFPIVATGSGPTARAEGRADRATSTSLDRVLRASTLATLLDGGQVAPRPILASGFVFVPDADALANLACVPGIDGAGQLATMLGSMLKQSGLDPQLVIVLATQPLVCGDIFYRALANDIRGIGYEHEATGELFDQTPDSRLEGMAFLNDFPYWQAHPAEFQNDFDHEVGHRWGARVHARIDGADSTELLGRDLQHWSYFLDSGGSPLEGNVWTDLGAGVYQADTPLGPGTFSPLDLYAMGVLPAAQVGPQRLLRPGAAPPATDCLGGTLAAASPPQSCGPYQTPATPVSFTIDDVVAVEGERDPPAGAAPVTVDVAVMVLASGTKPLDVAGCQAMADAVPARIADFAMASGGRVLLNDIVPGGMDCVALAALTDLPAGGGGCAVAPGGCPPSAAAFVTLALLFTLRARRRRAAVTPPAS